MKEKEPLVSIITPTYCCEEYIEQTILSVINQSYQNWELLIIDDCSTDHTVGIVEKYKSIDSRIKLTILKEKGGASIARNRGIMDAQGRYISFLDGDDLWTTDKLEKQVKFMQENSCYFSYTNYYILGESESPKIFCSPKSIDYSNMLKCNRIGCLTVMYDTSVIGKKTIPKIDKRNDYALWLTILRTGVKGYLFDEPLAYYRSHQGLSRGGKHKLIKYHYKVYRYVLKYNKITSSVLTVRNIICYLFYNKVNRIMRYKE